MMVLKLVKRKGIEIGKAQGIEMGKVQGELNLENAKNLLKWYIRK